MGCFTAGDKKPDTATLVLIVLVACPIVAALTLATILSFSTIWLLLSFLAFLQPQEYLQQFLPWCLSLLLVSAPWLIWGLVMKWKRTIASLEDFRPMILRHGSALFVFLSAWLALVLHSLVEFMSCSVQETSPLTSVAGGLVAAWLNCFFLWLLAASTLEKRLRRPC